MIKLTARNIAKSYSTNGRELRLFHHLSFVLGSNKFYCLFGPSGSGKTTLLNIIAHLTVPDTGTLEITKDNTPISISAIRVGYVFQDDRLLPWKTVAENIDFILQPHVSSLAKRRERIRYFLDLTHLLHKAHSYPRSLSGGEKQRANLARALSIDPEVIFMDEPYSHLDELTARQLRIDLMRIWTQNPKPVVFVSHNPLESIFLADEILCIPRVPFRRLRRIYVSIPRPRSDKFYEDFIFEPATKNILKNLLGGNTQT